ncbi:MAG: short-chain dehydrogenase [Halieaceae bacterium MED-G27]|jgi:NAD(P)-dependent dehydrogenase (short-subunit alcohol dehydrogenase family)|nr:short-chain dehydrogenase [Halieaceae bacterium]OUT66206.1 MAG: short-chain dehydrogenase [Cellvibrionales bacterium TMED21]PDH36345.1 MAG: short-chain dehydrogenase [Halieaceae bacterium MED-G27]
MQIAGAVIVVTGGASGIGRALATRFIADGAKAVVIADFNADAVAAVGKTIGAQSFAVDVRDEAAIAAMVASVEAEHGQIDLFCSNAGIIGVDGEPWWATGADNEMWQRMWEVHVMSHVYAARASLPAMIKRGSGHFLNTASAAGLLSQIGSAPYSVTKHAAVAFAESLAITHGDDGIKVSCLCPQAVDTAMTAGTDGGGVAGVDGMLSPEAVADAVVKGLAEESFLILPHPEVEEYRQNKARSYERWIGGMRKLRRLFTDPTGQ